MSLPREWPSSLQLIGSKGLGGAERWFQRFARALADYGAPAALGVRAGGALDRAQRRGQGPRLPCARLPFCTVWDPASQVAVSALVRRSRPAIVQTYLGRATRLTRLSRRSGAAAAVHLARLGGYYRLSCYRHADAWIGNTRGLCDWMIAQGLPASRVHQIYNFVDAPRPRPAPEIDGLRAALGLAADERVLICLGRLIALKGHRYLLDALARLPAEIGGRRWRLLLLGDGPLRAALQRQTTALGLEARVRLLGWRPDPAPFFQLADLVVFPSLENETLGNVILEAWAWQRPLVTARFRGARELVHPGEDGWCVSCGDARALAEGLRALLADPALAAELARRGRERAAREFSRDAIMQRYWALYSELADG